MTHFNCILYMSTGPGLTYPPGQFPVITPTPAPTPFPVPTAVPGVIQGSGVAPKINGS